MPANFPKLQPFALLLAVVAIAFLFYRDHQHEQKLNLLLVNQAQQAAANGRSGRDPYLKNQVRNRIIKGYPEIQHCYKVYLTQEPERTDGRIKMDWQIDKSGAAVNPEVVSSPFADRDLHECLAAHIREWSFPAPAVRKYVTHTFKFAKDE